MNTSIAQNIRDIIKDHISWKYNQTLTKYSYINRWAYDFIDFTQSPHYQWYNREIDILRNIYFSSSYDQVLDLWPGNGIKWKLVMQQMRSKVQKYLAVDISHQMLNFARNNQRDIQDIQRQYIQSDFDFIQNIIPYKNKSSLIMILWNTITNFVDIKKYLKKLYDIIHYNDLLLLGIEIHNSQNIKSLITEYNTPENKVLTFRPLEYIWIPQSAWYVEIIFNKKLFRIEERFIVKKDLIIDIHIPMNSKILLSVTIKPTLPQLIEYVQESGFKIQQSHNLQEQYILCVSK